MNEYIIIKTHSDGYDRLVLCLTSESLTTYRSNLETALAQEIETGKILIDQLMVTGNGPNRYISCEFSDGRLDFKTAQIANPAESFREETVKRLHDNHLYIENSILTEEQRQKVKDNIVF